MPLDLHEIPNIHKPEVTEYSPPSHKRTYYVWSGGSVMAEYNEPDFSTATEPRWTKSYIYLGSRLLATLTSSGASELVQYHHQDRLGTRLITNAANTTVVEQVTLPFGVALQAESTGASNRRFTSYDRTLLLDSRVVECEDIVY